MIEIRLHGRGGQGAVVASVILASASFKEGRHVQAFPLFGGERRGAPVTAFARVADEPILVHCQVYAPDHVVVLDPSLIRLGNVAAGLKEGGWIVVNSERDPSEFGFPERFRVATVDASGIAVRHHLGSRTTPIVNTAILGGLARATGLVGMEALLAAVRVEVPVNPDANVAAVNEAYQQTRLGGGGTR